MSGSVRVFIWLLVVSAALFSAYWFCSVAQPLDESQLKKEYTGEILGCDFYMRYNEIACLREGIDPFDVWSGAVSHPKYVSNCQLDRRTDTWYEPINAYTPWSYVFFMPLTFVPRTQAWWWYWGLMLVATLMWVGVAFAYGRRHLGGWTGGAFSSGLALCLGPALASGLICANYTVVIAGALAVLVYGLSRQDRLGDGLAGLALALAMTKPQLSLLVTVPMLIKRRFWPLAVGAAVCLVATAIASSLCGKSVMTLILEAPQGNVFAFKGCGLMPLPLYDLLVSWGVAKGLILTLTSLVGLMICVFLTWTIRREEDWMRLVVPALVCSVAWTYVQPPSHLMSWAVMATLAVELFRNERTVSRFWFGLAIVLVGRFYYIPVKLIQKLSLFPGDHDSLWTLFGDLSAFLSVVVIAILCCRYWCCSRKHRAE